MKNFLFLAYMCFVFCAQAQTEQGGFLISGNASYEHGTYKSNVNSDAISELVISPQIGYFVINHFCAGLSLPVNISSSKYASTNSLTISERKARSIGVGPFIRYYFPVQKQLFVIAEASYSWNYVHAKYPPSESIQKTDTKMYKVGAGLSYFLNKSVGIEMMASYRKYPNVQSFFTQTGLSLEVGFQIYLPR